MGEIFTEEELKEKCLEWQKILRLQDWTIVVHIERQRDLPDGAQANVRYTLSTKKALIRLVDATDYPPDSMLPQDMEHSLVHELLHLHLGPCTTEDGTITEDQAIESIADGLIYLKRTRHGSNKSY
ncbi:MAG: hypothetical protein WC834_00015 [Eubacteriales bacterium]